MNKYGELRERKHQWGRTDLSRVPYVKWSGRHFIEISVEKYPDVQLLITPSLINHDLQSGKTQKYTKTKVE